MNLRPPGYEHPDTRPRRLKPSPLTHGVPSQRVHTCRDVWPVSECPGYTFGYTPIDHCGGGSPSVESLGRTQPFGRHALATHLQVHHGSPGLGWSPTALPDLMAFAGRLGQVRDPASVALWDLWPCRRAGASDHSETDCQATGREAGDACLLYTSDAADE